MSADAGSNLAQLAAAWLRFKTLCVTGTKGKTTTTSMLAAIVAASGEPEARYTTLGAWVNGAAVGGPPDRRLEGFLEAARDAEARAIAVEVVSLALATGFARTFPADVAVFTNLLKDHDAVHGGRDGYLQAKAELFVHLRPEGAAVLNAADAASAEIDRLTPAAARRAAYAVGDPAPEWTSLPLTLQARTVKTTRDGTEIVLAPGDLAGALGGSLSLRVVGAPNAHNALAAAVAAHAAGYPADAIQRGLAGFEGLPGRFQVVSQRPWVIVDFAHTPDALRRVLEAVRAVLKAEKSTGSVTCVFGCGGERSHERRAPLGHVAASRADHVIVTADNPRSEDPAAIARDIERGFADARAEVTRVRELDRRRAIEGAVHAARPEDVIVIAGKGHETVQELRGRVVPWSDVEVARAAVAARPRPPGRTPREKP
jgi:UDP-N-acetylmuramoyl-L-alanyl-D-glutamate--2,6-diaminopimelate ligase